MLGSVAAGAAVVALPVGSLGSDVRLAFVAQATPDAAALSSTSDSVVSPRAGEHLAPAAATSGVSTRVHRPTHPRHSLGRPVVTGVNSSASGTAALRKSSARVESAAGGRAGGGFARPVSGRVTSSYGARGSGTHYGLDVANRIGTPVRAAAPGTVISAGPARGFGLWVRVRHDDGTVSVYGHVNTALVEVGQKVGAGQVIAEVGNRGQSTGPHLHFELHAEDGTKLDPGGWLAQRGVSP